MTNIDGFTINTPDIQHPVRLEIVLRELWLEQIFYSGDKDDEKCFHVDVHGTMYDIDETPVVFSITSHEVMEQFKLHPDTPVRVFRQSTNSYDTSTTLGAIWPI